MTTSHDIPMVIPSLSIMIDSTSGGSIPMKSPRRVALCFFVVITPVMVAVALTACVHLRPYPMLERFIVMTPGTYTLVVNDVARPLILANVSRQDDWEFFTGTVNGHEFQIGNRNRSYLIRDEFCHYWIKLTLDALDIPPPVPSSLHVSNMTITEHHVTADVKLSEDNGKIWSFTIDCSDNGGYRVNMTAPQARE